MPRLRNPKVNNRTSASKYSNWLYPLGKLTVLEKKSKIHKSFKKKKRNSKFLRVRFDAGSWGQVQQCVPPADECTRSPSPLTCLGLMYFGSQIFFSGVDSTFSVHNPTQSKSVKSELLCVFPA